MFVIKIGGSILFDQQLQINHNLILEYAKTIKNILQKNKRRCVIVVGGGKLARKYIQIARKLGASESFNDVIGIESAKLNARLLISSLGEQAYPCPPDDFREFQTFFSSSDKVIVCGGFQPGQSTNAVAALIAEFTQAQKLFNLTNVDGVYSADPQKDPTAKFLTRVTISELTTLMTAQQTKAGDYPLYDLTALQIVRRSKIPLHFLNGHNPSLLLAALNEEDIGTLVAYD
ncbi:MAG: UMP kinase [Candidatus Heimdallarchaeota archaeon]|nr:UMP kinase [Candidatus Heimdallarchaeota archaeon]